MSEDKPKRKPRAKQAEAQPVEAPQAPQAAKEAPQALSVAEINALPAEEQRAALELHAKIGDDKRWAKVMLNVKSKA